MKKELKTLTQLFSNNIFRIPDYQRGFAWGEKEINEFWNDLIRLDTNSKKEHYVGVLTLETAKPDNYKKWFDDVWLVESKNYEPYYVVDGQQRLTTSIILIKAIIATMKNKNIQKLKDVP